jgi:hypothetical protein
MAKERVLVTVKTYPTLSKTYGETVCTAGVREDGTWVRIYPVPFRRLEEEEQYKKFDWLECGLHRNSKDPRPETYRPVDESELRPVGHVDTSNNWHERRLIMLKKARVYDRMDELIAGAKANRMSLAVFKPKRIIDFTCEKEDSRDWDPSRVEQMREKASQFDLFVDNKWRENFQIIPKLPYAFSYKFEDTTGHTRKLRVLDWETGQLFWNCCRKANHDEQVALDKVKQKYLTSFATKDLHFFVGTTQQFHFKAPNPWVIIGVFPIPYESQLALF